MQENKEISGIKKVKEFDKKLMEKESYSFLMGKVVIVLLSGIGVLMMMIMPIQDQKEFPQLPALIFLMSGMPIPIYMANFMKVPGEKQSEKNENIYTILRWFPVSSKDIYHVRLGYLKSYCIKLTSALTAAQVISAALSKKLAVWNILYPMGMGILIFLEGWIFIYPWKYSKLFRGYKL